MSDKFWAAAFTIASAAVGLVLKKTGNLNLWQEIVIVLLVGVAWLLAIYRSDEKKKRLEETGRAVKVYRAGYRKDTQFWDTMEPSDEWLRRWKAAGKLDRFTTDCD